MLDYNSTANLILGISQRSQGNLRVFLHDDQPEVRLNREKFFASCQKRVIAADLVHGNQVFVVNDETVDDIIVGCDALVTNNPKFILSITVADCLPLYFFDPAQKAVGIAHTGWRGVENQIAPMTVKSLQENYNSHPADIEVFVGPHIGVCHFEVQADLVAAFSGWPEFVHNQSGKNCIDLAEIVKQQLMAAGVLEKNINLSPECTYCLSDKYFSYRRDKPPLAELKVMAAYIGLK